MPRYKEDTKTFNKLYNTNIIYCDSIKDFESFLKELRKSKQTTKQYVVLQVNNLCHIAPIYIETNFNEFNQCTSQNVLNLDSHGFNDAVKLNITDEENVINILYTDYKRQASSIGCFENSLLLLKDFEYLQKTKPEYELCFGKFKPKSNFINKDGFAKMSTTSTFPSFLFKHTEYWRTIRNQKALKFNELNRSLGPVPYNGNDNIPGHYTDKEEYMDDFDEELEQTFNAYDFITLKNQDFIQPEFRKDEFDSEENEILQPEERQGRLEIDENRLNLYQFRFVNFELQHELMQTKFAKNFK